MTRGTDEFYVLRIERPGKAPFFRLFRMLHSAIAAKQRLEKPGKYAPVVKLQQFKWKDLPHG